MQNIRRKQSESGPESIGPPPSIWKRLQAGPFRMEKQSHENGGFPYHISIYHSLLGLS